MKFDVTNTMYADAIQSAHIAGVRYIPLENTTINEKLGIVVPVDDELLPELGYYMIGLSYQDLLVNDDIELDLVRHSPKDALPFKPVPFICKPLVNDITVNERAGYALRTTFIDSGIEYVAYYAKKLNEKSEAPLFIEGDLEGDNINIGYFTPDGTELNPVPAVGMDINATRLDFVATTLQLKLRLTASDFILIQEGIDILYPTEVDPSIREVALVTGIPVTISGGIELASCQTAYFIKEDYIVDTGINMGESVVNVNYEIGSLESKITRTYE